MSLASVGRKTVLTQLSAASPPFSGDACLSIKLPPLLLFVPLEGMSEAVVVLDSVLSSSPCSPEELGPPKRAAEETSSDRFGAGVVSASELLVPLLTSEQ